MSEHTPEPWTYWVWSKAHTDKSGASSLGWSDDSGDHTIADFTYDEDCEPEEQEANARRIVECVNACAGIKDPSVVKEMMEFLREQARVSISRTLEAVAFDAQEILKKIEGAEASCVRKEEQTKAIEAGVAEWRVDPKTGETEFVYLERP